MLSLTDDIGTILCINKEINRTIINATHLEHTLYAKLSAQSGGCCWEEADCSCMAECEEQNAGVVREDTGETL